MPVVSVILPNYNYARYLAQRIDSILNQTFIDFELIILDDASTDNSLQIVKSYKKKDKRIHVIRNKTNSGNPFKQWQKGILYAKGEFIWIAEADDWCEATFLETLLSEIKRTGSGMAFCNSYISDESGNIIGEWEVHSNRIKTELFNQNRLFKKKELINNGLAFENVIPNASGVLFQKKAYHAVGCVDMNVSTNADWLLWLKINTTFKISYIATPLNYFRRHKKSVIAVNNSAKSDSYQERYDESMRKTFLIYTQKNQIRIKRNTRKTFKKYIAWDQGNRALWLIKQRRILKALPLLIKVSIALKSLGFIKKAVKNR